MAHRSDFANAMLKALQKPIEEKIMKGLGNNLGKVVMGMRKIEKAQSCWEQRITKYWWADFRKRMEQKKKKDEGILLSPPPT